jgi:hypothetical protein
VKNGPLQIALDCEATGVSAAGRRG